MATTPSDGEAIRESLTRPEAFEPVFDRHFNSIYKYLTRRVGPDAGNELASEVFLVAFSNRHRFHSEVEDARPWLYGIAANLARRQARTWRRSRRAGQRSLGDNVIWLDPAPEDRLDAESMRSVLLLAVSKLRNHEREVLLLHALTDLSYREIAAALSIPIGTVRSRLSRARRQVRGLLIEAGHPELAAGLEEEDDGNAG
ncbi:MAG: RNA polymerase sigma factor [Acidimicrobiia bacterium]|nr:RNA polymerase sigma factor [Acidimicrobiia bacterium]